MKSWIIAVGDEVLSGKVVNTNSSYLSSNLEMLGIVTKKSIIIGDDKEAIKKELNSFLNSDSDLLITTGGLGPTHDDFTKEVICETLGYELEVNQIALDILNNYFKSKYPSCNNKQTMFPKNAIIIPNYIGTACGCILEHQDKIIVILVGPPIEMKPMVDDFLLKYLINKNNNELLIKQYIIMGTTESMIEEKIKRIEDDFIGVSICPYCSLGKIRFQITSNKTYQDNFNKACLMFEEQLEEYIISTTNQSIEEVVVNKLLDKKYKISFAESCTGGLLASTIINVSGASQVVDESFVTYANEAKVKYLKVKEDTISKFGVVSDEVVQEMANGLYALTKADVCIAVSGIAGPTGGTINKPVGLVHYAIKIKDQIYIEHQVFPSSREMVRNRSTLWILYRLFRLLK